MIEMLPAVANVLPYDVELPVSDSNLDALCRPRGGLARSVLTVSPGLRRGAKGPAAPRGFAYDTVNVRNLPQQRASRDDLAGHGRGTRPAIVFARCALLRQASCFDLPYGWCQVGVMDGLTGPPTVREWL